MTARVFLQQSYGSPCIEAEQALAPFADLGTAHWTWRRLLVVDPPCPGATAADVVQAIDGGIASKQRQH